MFPHRQSRFFSCSSKSFPLPSSPSLPLLSPPNTSSSTAAAAALPFPSRKIRTELISRMTSASSLLSSHNPAVTDLDHFAADAAGHVIRQYFRNKVEIIDRENLSPVTIADRAAEESMIQFY